LDLIAPTADVFNYWFCGLKACLKNVHNERTFMDLDYRYFKLKWDEAGGSKHGWLTKKQVVQLVSSLNVDRPRKLIHGLFKEVDKDNNGTLDYDEFITLMEMLRTRYNALKDSVDDITYLLVMNIQTGVRVLVASDAGGRGSPGGLGTVRSTSRYRRELQKHTGHP